MIPSIEITELLSYHNANIIDIRSTQSYNNNHIDHAINVPLTKLLANPNKYLDKFQKYFIYCQKGTSSIRVCKILYNQGYKVVNITGGYEEWIMKK